MSQPPAVILAGGLGTRLRDSVSGLPKSMAPVAGKPFLHYLLGYLRNSGIGEAWLCLGYRHQDVEDWCRDQVRGISLHFLVEPFPLGTGGALKSALVRIPESPVLVVNGDTYFEVDLDALSRHHRDREAEVTLALKPMQDFDRYGSVETGEGGRITAFREKMFREHGLVNGGVYLIENRILEGFPESFSLERDFLEKEVGKRKFYGLISGGYFIDIGIPSDYQKAQTEIPRHASN